MEDIRTTESDSDCQFSLHDGTDHSDEIFDTDGDDKLQCRVSHIKKYFIS